MKACTKCNEMKPLTAFSKRGDGVASRCKECANAYNRAHYARTPNEVKRTRLIRSAAAYRERDDLKKVKAQWREKNAAHRLEYMKAYYERNKDKWAYDGAKDVARATKRRAARLQAIPAWADHEAMQVIYERAATMKKAGVDCHVDHIVPLQSRYVCGFHSHHNLTVINARENRSKGNRHWPDC